MTTEVLQGERIAQAILETQPSRVAVAYLGNDWRSYLPEVSKLETVVLAPVLGTNPWAVQELINAFDNEGMDGWERVHFLKRLHAKLYLGESSAIWGSANLSRNGLSGERLVELCAGTRDKTHLAQLHGFFKETLAAARQEFPTAQDRRIQLDRLMAQTQRNPDVLTSCTPTLESTPPSLRDFELLAPDHFYVCLYDPGETFEYTDAVGELANHIENECHFAAGDSVVKGKWILSCALTSKYKASRRHDPCWMLIDDVIENGVQTKPGRKYPQLAMQRNDIKRPRNWEALAPFELTSEAMDAVRAAVGKKDVQSYFVEQEEQPVRLEQQRRGLPLLVDRMKAQLAAQDIEYHVKRT